MRTPLVAASAAMLVVTSAVPAFADSSDDGIEVETSAPKEPTYRDLLARVPVTRDIGVPGIEGFALRLIPTRTALAGTPAPVVVIPRVVGTEWYGAEIVVRF